MPNWLSAYNNNLQLPIYYKPATNYVSYSMQIYRSNNQSSSLQAVHRIEMQIIQWISKYISVVLYSIAIWLKIPSSTVVTNHVNSRYFFPYKLRKELFTKILVSYKLQTTLRHFFYRIQERKIKMQSFILSWKSKKCTYILSS